MTKQTATSDDRPIGAALVAAIFAAIGAGMAAVMWGFGINETGATFIALWLVIFIVLWLGWRDELPPPGTKKAPTVDSHTSVGSASGASGPSASSSSSASARASSSGTAQAGTTTPSAMAKASPEATAAPIPAVPSAPEAMSEGSPAEGKRPESLSAARDGNPDDLKQIKGVGPALERLCHSLGFYHFDQIASWTPAEVAWVDENLEGFKGRVTRDDWVAQAKVLAAGGSTEFSDRVEKGDVY